MKRVVVTGMGIVSSIGNNAQEVLASLREAKSGIVKADKYAELGFRCQVHGAPKLDWEDDDRPQGAPLHGRGRRLELCRHGAGDPAIRVLRRSDISNERTGLIMGSGGPSTRAIVQAADTTREQGPQEGRPLRSAQVHVFDEFGDAVDALSHQGRQLFDLLGLLPRARIASATAAELIQLGKQDVVFAGGGEELDWTLSVLFDAMNAMSSRLQRPARDGQPRL